MNAVPMIEACVAGQRDGHLLSRVFMYAYVDIWVGSDRYYPILSLKVHDWPMEGRGEACPHRWCPHYGQAATCALCTLHLLHLLKDGRG